MLKKFEDFKLNEESQFPFHLFDCTPPKIDEEWFEKRIKSDLIDIIMQEKGISEKSFSQVQEVMNEMGSFMQQGHPFRNKLNELINVQGSRECRSRYWAERAYEEIYKNRLRA